MAMISLAAASAWVVTRHPVPSGPVVCLPFSTLHLVQRFTCTQTFRREGSEASPLALFRVPAATPVAPRLVGAHEVSTTLSDVNISRSNYMQIKLRLHLFGLHTNKVQVIIAM